MLTASLDENLAMAEVGLNVIANAFKDAPVVVQDVHGLDQIDKEVEDIRRFGPGMKQAFLDLPLPL